MIDQTDMFGHVATPASALAKRFGVPPFSVLSARDGDWQERKRKWLALGIQSELGRGGASRQETDYKRNGAAVEALRRPSAETCVSGGRQ